MSRGAWGLAIVIGISLTIGFIAGYKAKEWRIKFLKRRRDRLSEKLYSTQRQIENIAH